MYPFCVDGATVGACGYMSAARTGREALAEDLWFAGRPLTDSKVEFFQHRDFKTPSLRKTVLESPARASVQLIV